MMHYSADDLKRPIHEFLDQFDQGMECLGFTEEEADKIYAVWSCCLQHDTEYWLKFGYPSYETFHDAFARREVNVMINLTPEEENRTLGEILDCVIAKCKALFPNQPVPNKGAGNLVDFARSMTVEQLCKVSLIQD